jgi:hypothetical protein
VAFTTAPASTEKSVDLTAHLLFRLGTAASRKLMRLALAGILTPLRDNLNSLLSKHAFQNLSDAFSDRGKAGTASPVRLDQAAVQAGVGLPFRNDAQSSALRSERGLRQGVVGDLEPQAPW